MVIFHCYVSSPEGTLETLGFFAIPLQADEIFRVTSQVVPVESPLLGSKSPFFF